MNRSEPAGRPAAARQAGAIVPRILAMPAIVADTALAARLVVLVINLAASGSRPEPAPDMALLVVGAAAIAVRRRSPLAVLAATLAPYVLTPHAGPAQAPELVALYTVATMRSQRTAILATTLTAIASVVAVTARGDSAAVAVGRVLAVAVVALAGLVVAERRGQREREARMLAHIAATDERMRIARELHDVVAHHLSVIVVQATSPPRLSLPMSRRSPRRTPWSPPAARRSPTRAGCSGSCAPMTAPTIALPNLGWRRSTSCSSASATPG